jgi:parvulin-like peptidyl-prolyl isomerase
MDALEVGEVSALVETEYGWHIIKVEESREQRTKPLDEVSEQIEQTILQQRNITAYQEFLAEVREAADIEILIDELKLPEADEPRALKRLPQSSAGAGPSGGMSCAR